MGSRSGGDKRGRQMREYLKGRYPGGGYVCTDCGRSFFDAGALEDHRNYVHRREKKNQTEEE